jgi:hypothetical protein
MMDGSKDVKLTIRIPLELREAAKEKAAREDLTLSQVIRHYLREWIKNDPPTDKQEEDQPSKSE